MQAPYWPKRDKHKPLCDWLIIELVSLTLHHSTLHCHKTWHCMPCHLPLPPQVNKSVGNTDWGSFILCCLCVFRIVNVFLHLMCFYKICIVRCICKCCFCCCFCHFPMCIPFVCSVLSSLGRCSFLTLTIYNGIYHLFFCCSVCKTRHTLFEL